MIYRSPKNRGDLSIPLNIILILRFTKYCRFKIKIAPICQFFLMIVPIWRSFTKLLWFFFDIQTDEPIYLLLERLKKRLTSRSDLSIFEKYRDDLPIL